MEYLFFISIYSHGLARHLDVRWWGSSSVAVGITFDCESEVQEVAVYFFWPANKGPARTQEVRVPELCGAKFVREGVGENPHLSSSVLFSR